MVDVADSDVDEAIKRIADQNRNYADKGEGAKAESGDRVTMSFKGSIDGMAFDGGTGEGIQVVIGSNTFIPGFEDQLIGIGKDETRTLKVPFPKNYASSRTGRKGCRVRDHGQPDRGAAGHQDRRRICQVAWA